MTSKETNTKKFPAEVQEFAEIVIDNVEKVIVGKRPSVELILNALLCEGHVLIEDAPGTGKTMLARAIAITTGLEFKRIQSGKIEFTKSPFSIANVIDEQLTIYESQISGKDIEIIKDIDVQLPELVIGDDMRLGQVLFSVIFCLPMRSIVPHRAPRVLCWKRWGRDRLLSMA